MKSVLLAVALLSLPAVASEVPAATVALTGSPVTTVLTAGAALVVLCPSTAVRYAPGSASSPPTATSSSFPIDYATAPTGKPVQLASTEDRISLLGPKGYTCLVFTQSTPAPTSASPLSITSPKCSSLVKTVVSVGVTAVTVPTTSQSARLGVEICNSGENPGSPKVKCLNDATPVMGASNPGDVLVAGGLICQFYAVDSTHPIKCIADTASTAVTTSECLP